MDTVQSVLSHRVLCGDNACIPLADKSVDLVFTSPPYEDARLYGELGFRVKGQDWVDWAVPRFIECLRVSRGLVAWVVEGKTRQFRWSATPALMMADLHRKGICLRKPPIFHRVGIPGSGGPDWLRNDFEWIVCATNGGQLPWSDTKACGHPPKWPVGGKMSNRTQDGSRVSRITKPRGVDGELLTQGYRPPETVNPGNSINKTYTVDEVQHLLSEAGDVTHHNAGGGVMGHALCHENEAPFPEKLADFFVRSFCPPGGTVLDTHCGSGTTLAAAHKAGRNGVGIDVRASQCELTQRRMREECGVEVSIEQINPVHQSN